jgi:hypothetical protein
VLRYSGKYEEVEGMYRRALAGREKVLGVDHGLWLASVDNLALVLGSMEVRRGGGNASAAVGGKSEDAWSGSSWDVYGAKPRVPIMSMFFRPNLLDRIPKGGQPKGHPKMRVFAPFTK